jgi:hypothetical protein
MIALWKYGSGLPFNRLERLQSGLGEAISYMLKNFNELTAHPAYWMAWNYRDMFRRTDAF